MRNTKTAHVLAHLKTYKTITSWEAIQRYGATRLSAIIFNLKKRGYNIQTNMVLGEDRNGNTTRYGIYTLVEEIEKEPDS